MPVAVEHAVRVREALRGAVVKDLWDTGDQLKIHLSKNGRNLTLVIRADIDCQYYEDDTCIDEDAAPIVEYEVISGG